MHTIACFCGTFTSLLSLLYFELLRMIEIFAPPVMSSETADAALATNPGKLIVTFRCTTLSDVGLEK